MKTLGTMFFLSHGRIARSTWLFRLTLLVLFSAAFGLLSQSAWGDRGGAIFSVIFLWCAGAVSTQRLHDLGRTGWALCSVLIPVVGPLWLLLQLCGHGVEGKNRFGSDPATRADYLQVSIGG